MRISDWSSDVCSSDLLAQVMAGDESGAEPAQHDGAGQHRQRDLRGESGEFEPAAVAGGQLRQRFAQRVAGGGQQAKRDRAGADAVPRTQVQERPADESVGGAEQLQRSEEHTSELQSLMRISYAVFSWKKKK